MVDGFKGAGHRALADQKNYLKFGYRIGSTTLRSFLLNVVVFIAKMYARSGPSDGQKHFVPI